MAAKKTPSKSSATAAKAATPKKTPARKKPTNKSRPATAVNKLSREELAKKINDIDLPDEELAQYFKLSDETASGFAPQVVLDRSLIEDDGLEGGFLINGANSIARWRRNKLYKRRIKKWTGVKIVAEGDSWFQYPILLKDVIDQLNDLDNFQYAIYGLSEAGDVLDNMIKEDELTEAIEKHNPHVFLISGGGNDMVGDNRMAKMVHPFRQGLKAEDYPNQKFVEFIDQISGLYRRLFQRLVSRFPHLKIVCHGYDKAIPDQGDWLGKPLASRGITNARTQAGIVATMIDRFNDSLSLVASHFPGRVYYVDCRDEIGAKSHWHDELHPKNEGYFKVAELFDKTIKKALSESTKGAALDIESDIFSPAFKGSPQLMTNPSQLSNEEFLKLVTERANANLPGKVDEPTDKIKRRGLEMQLEKVNLSRDFLPSSFLEVGVERLQAVCRIDIRSALGDGYGTGFLIGTRNFIMTNNHVLPDAETAESSKAIFDYDHDDVNHKVQLRPDRFFITHKQLDFTIVACDSSPLPPHIQPVQFPTDPYTVTRNERVNIIQHPDGRRKEVSIHDNKVSYVYQEVIRYRTDTEGGSSGSPVFNNEWVLCALHHAGVKHEDETATNEGIKISAILDYLRSLNSNEATNVLDEIIKGEPSKPVKSAAQDAGASHHNDNPGGVTINLTSGASITINT